MGHTIVVMGRKNKPKAAAQDDGMFRSGDLPPSDDEADDYGTLAKEVEEKVVIEDKAAKKERKRAEKAARKAAEAGDAEPQEDADMGEELTEAEQAAARRAK